jgi:hypothetical protein
VFTDRSINPPYCNIKSVKAIEGANKYRAIMLNDWRVTRQLVITEGRLNNFKINKMMKIRVKEIIDLNARIREINSVDLEDIEF